MSGAEENVAVTAEVTEEVATPAAESTDAAEEEKTAAPSETKSTRLYVGNLAYSVRWQGLKDHMRQAGDVKHVEVFQDYNGRSKGCGIVEFNTVEDAQRAISELNDTELEGRKIFVREDREPNNSGRTGAPAGRGRGGAVGGIDRSQCQVYVGNLDYSVSWQDLKDLFKEEGFNPLRTDILGNDGLSKGAGTVLFATPQEAQDAIAKLNGFEFHGRRMDVHMDKFAGRGYRGGRGRGRF